MKTKKIKNYNILGQSIGKGAFATVYKVEKQDEPGEYYAAKVIFKQKIKDKYMKQALKAQIKIIQKIQSQHVIMLKQVIQTKKYVCLIQKLCEKDLQTKIEENSRIQISEAIKIMVEILDGYLQLVKNSVIHRDLKPENILISNNHYFISDFGFAKCMSSLQKNMTQTKIGTPYYMSPQLLNSENYTYKCDIWALGLIFYQMIHGYLPWQAESEAQLLDNIKSSPIETRIKFEDPFMKELLINCLKYEQKDRYGWRQLYKHKFFCQMFRQKILEMDSIELRCMKIINEIKKKIKTSNINLKKLFQEFELTNSKSLDKKGLCKLFLSIDNNININQVGYVYAKFDIDNSGDIDFQQFRSWLEDNQVQMNIESIYTKQFKNLSGSEKKITELMRRLKLSIQEETIDLYTIFKSLDKDDSDELDKYEINRLFELLGTRISSQQLDVLFSMFDVDGSGYISFQQFKQEICKITGKPQIYDDKFRQKLRKMEQQADQLTTIKQQIISHQTPNIMILSKNPFLTVK